MVNTIMNDANNIPQVNETILRGKLKDASHEELENTVIALMKTVAVLRKGLEVLTAQNQQLNKGAKK